MSGSKRQRRSYSCGPCKLLKIKCDLQLPCSSCLKFKREDKCMESPPHPPSANELRVIQERKERMSKRKKESPPLYPGDSNGEHPQPNGSTPSNSDVPPNYQFVANAPQHFVVQSQYYRAPAPLVAPPRFSSFTGLMPKDSVKPIASIRSIQLALESLPYNENPYKQLEDFFSGKKIKFSFFDQDWTTLKLYYFPRGVSIFEETVKLESGTQSKISAADVNLLKLTFPNPENICYLFLGHFKSFKSYLLDVADYVTTLKFTIKFSELLASAEFNKPLVINDFQHRLMALSLSTMASGILLYPNMQLSSTYSNTEITTKWILLSKKIKEIYKKADTLYDIVYLLIWYFLIDNYYHLENMLVENHFEYNSLLSNLLFNKEHMEYLLNRNLDQTKLSGDKLAEFRLLAKFWLKLRVIELDGLYFQYKSSLLRSNNILKNSIIPNDRILDILYTGGLKGVSDDVLRTMYEIAKQYFNQFDSVIDAGSTTRAITKSYLSVYQHIHSVVGLDVVRYQDEINNGNVPDIDYTTILFFLRNQLLLMANTKWLTLLRIEKGYFPSLRYASFLTSILAGLNHYTYLDKLIEKSSNGRDSLLKMFESSFSLYPVVFILHCVVLQQFFLICIKGFVTSNPVFNADRVVNLEQFFNGLDKKFNSFMNKFKRDFNGSQSRLIPLYRNTMQILEDLALVQSQMSTNHTYKTEEFYEILSSNLRNVSLFVDLFFGCKSTLMNYLGKLFDLFEFINETPKSEKVPISSTVEFNDELLSSFRESFVGFGIDQQTLDGYLEVVVDPILDERDS